jgi:hypothetical protein
MCVVAEVVLQRGRRVATTFTDVLPPARRLFLTACLLDARAST